MPLHHLFIGTYTSHGSKGIYAVEFDGDTGKFGAVTLAAETAHPTYLTLSPDGHTLYAVSESAGLASAFSIGSDRRTLSPLGTPQPSSGKPPCHLATDQTGRVLLAAHYHTGIVASIPITAHGALATPASVIRHTGSSIDPERQTSPHPHSVTVSPDNRYVFACDLGTDQIFIYRLDLETGLLTPHEPAFISTTPGSGPRHLAFTPDGTHAFMISEMGGTVTAYQYDSARGTLLARDSQSALPTGFDGANKSAAIRVHPNGRIIYASNRGPDTIAVLNFDPSTGRLSLVQTVASGGAQPRDFNLSPDGRWLIAANQDTHSLNVFQIAPDTGLLSPTPETIEVRTPVCVLFSD